MNYCSAFLAAHLLDTKPFLLSKYFTKEILEQLDNVCGKEFKYGDVIDTETSQDNES